MEDLATPSSASLIESDSAAEEFAVPAPVSRRKSARKTSSTHGRTPREIGLMRKGTDSTSASFVGSASGIHFVRTVYNAFAKKAGNRNLPSVEQNLVPGEDDHLGEDAESLQVKSSILWSETETIPQELRTSEDYKSSLSFEDLADWTRSYFDTWHPPFPFLHAPSVMIALEKLSLGRLDELDDMSFVTVRSVISISLADARQSGQGHSKLVPACLTFQTFDEALVSLQFVLVKPTSLASLQAAVSVQLFLVSMLRLNAASRLGGLIVRMAFHLGLHRCPARFSSFSNIESQLRQRLFWSIYCLDRYLCQSLGLPLNIRDHDVDVCYPDEEMHSSESNIRGPKASDAVPQPGSDGRLSLLRLLAKHAKFRGMILELRNKSIQHALESADRAIFIGAQLSKWWNEVEDLLEESMETRTSNFAAQPLSQEVTTPGSSNRSILKPFHQLVLLVSKHESLIALNRPVITTSKGTAVYAAALQTCIESSRTIISLLKTHLTHETMEESETVGRNQSNEIRSTTALIWPSFTWAVWMSAFVLIYAAAESHISQQTASRCGPVHATSNFIQMISVQIGKYADQKVHRNAEYSLSILRHLSLRGNTWADACESAIRDLQTAQLRNISSGQKRKGEWQTASPKRPTATASYSAQSSHRSDDALAYAFDDTDKAIPSTDTVPATRGRMPMQQPWPSHRRHENTIESAHNRIQQQSPFYPLPSHSDMTSHSLEPPGDFSFLADEQLGSNSGTDWFRDQQFDSLFQAAGNASLRDDPFGVIEMPLYFAGGAGPSFAGD